MELVDRGNEDEVTMMISESSNCKFPLPSSSNHNLWLDEASRSEPNLHKNIDFMDLSKSDQGDCTNIDSIIIPTPKEHMFNKVVTPSDVGKLNRLVIPKQHAEKYFPLDSSSNEKGLLLNFEDTSGKQWRFRYSYWNSSQSYVMTKGWSRFVKDKKLDAGDTVSFERCVGDKNRLFIDWRRRPEASIPPSFSPMYLWGSGGGGGRNLLLQQPSVAIHSRHEQLQQFNYNYNVHPYYYLRPSLTFQQQPSNVPMVINSVPLLEGKSSGKKLRLFGVNMECGSKSEDSECEILPSTTLASYRLGLQNSSSSTTTTTALTDEYSNKGKSKSTLSFDLGL